MKKSTMVKRPRLPVEAVTIRYRGVWPMDRAYPIVDATSDCIMRLLCSSVFNGFAHGQIAFDIEKKLKEQQAKQAERWRVITEAEQELREQFPFIGTNETIPPDILDTFKEADKNHRALMTKALEGDVFKLEGHEVELLRKAIDVCHDPSQYVDKTKVMSAEHSRWYTPILRVLSGAITESSAPAEPLTSENQE